MNERKEIAIPFVGFYNSIMDDLIDDAEAIFLDDDLYPNPELDYGRIWDDMAKLYVKFYDEFFKEETGIDLKLSFKELWSPREYNFETDRIYVEADALALQTVIEKIGEDKARKHLLECYKPRDGFMPFESTLENIKQSSKEWKNLFFVDILELIFESEVIYNSDMFCTQARECVS